ncbi:uncharacterized protein KIAA0825 homolog isoform X2 [Ambystoma mexicanum]|uniref:uncharacterized protein KIAA0825 homolog isoform X2 n=1 Tax=Ambystoma mexicanum TaxID=8296 RepID=UPI0037E90336
MDLGECSPDLSCLDCLVGITPGDLEIQQILSDIDEKLKTNAQRVEQCLQELQSDVNKTCPSELVQDTTGCLLWLNNCSFNSLKSSSTPQGPLLEFLKTLLSLLKKQQVEEEVILDFLQDLSNQCGVSFPCTPSGNSFHFTSRSSLHAIDDDYSMDVKSVWDNLRLHLRRFLVDKLQSQPEVSNVQSKFQLRTKCLQHLLFLYPQSEILTKYQSLQKKFVTDLLTTHTVPTLDAMNFEKVIHGYQSSFFVLYSMIKEDLHLLSGMVELPLIITFINETFLETLTEEVTALLGRLGVLHVKEGAQHAAKGIKSKHKGAVHALDTNYQKERGFCLNSDQQRFLSQLVKLLLWLEDRVKELSAETVYNPCYPDIGMNVKGKTRHIQGSLRKDGGELLADEPKAIESDLLPQQLLQVTEIAMLNFGWRVALKELAPAVMRCLPIAIGEFSSKILQKEQEDQLLALGSAMPLVSIQQTSESWNASHEDERPKQISKFCSEIMEELGTLLPLALACRGDFLQEIRATFVEVCCKVGTAVLARLEMRCNEVPSEAPVQNLHAALATAVYVHQRLTNYDGLLRVANKKPLFLLPVQRYQEFISTLRARITNYCVTVCATTVLQDAESHHWEDKNAFYEGERCSFAVQMWHYFCCGLQHDLWTILPPKTAQEILAEVLEESLAILSFRYSQAHPSCKRSSQIRIDVTTILLCAEKFLWSVCCSVRELCSPTQELCAKIVKIHIHCDNLLNALCVISAPLKVLHETLQNGIGDCSSPAQEQNAGWRHWLYSIEPSLIPSLLKTPSVGEMMILGQLKLLLSQPYCNRSLLLETLLLHGGLIAGILLSGSTLIPFQYEDCNNASEHCPVKVSTLTEAIFSVLSYCTLSPRSLGIVLERYLEEKQLWGLLGELTVNSCTKSEPEVIGCVKQTLINSVTGIVKQIVSLMQSWNTKENLGNYSQTQYVSENLLKTVPKEWNYRPKETKTKLAEECFTELTAQAVSIVIAKLPSAIACLLPSVKYFFFLSECKKSQHFSKSKEAGLLVWSLVTIVCQILEDGSTAEHLSGATLDRWSLERLGTVCACLETILGTQKRSPSQEVQKVLQSIAKQRPTWIQSQFQKARQLSIDGFSLAPEDSAAGEEGSCTLELTEQKTNTMVLDICHKPGGSEYLRHIYHIIQLNEEYLKEMLSLPNKKIQATRPLTSDMKSLRGNTLIFNPFQAIILPGSTLFHEAAANEWNWDWSNLLLNCRGLNEATFRAMLAHRGSQDPHSVGGGKMLHSSTVEEGNTPHGEEMDAKGKVHLQHGIPDSPLR